MLRHLDLLVDLVVETGWVDFRTFLEKIILKILYNFM